MMSSGQPIKTEGDTSAFTEETAPETTAKDAILHIIKDIMGAQTNDPLYLAFHILLDIDPSDDSTYSLGNLIFIPSDFDAIGSINVGPSNRTLRKASLSACS